MKRKILGISVSMLLLAFATQAQPPHPFSHGSDSSHYAMKRHAGPMRGHGGNFMNKLNLTADQKKQMKDINEDYNNRLAALDKNDKLKLGEYKTKRAALQKERRDKIQDIYTPEQKTQLVQMRQKASDMMQKRSDMQLQRMKDKLNLTDAQVASIKSQKEDLHKQMKDIFANNSMLPDERRQEVRSLMKKEKENFESVLTQEQKDKLQSLRPGKEVK